MVRAQHFIQMCAFKKSDAKFVFVFYTILFVSVLPLCGDLVLFGQSHYAHEVYGTS